jgi:hypothetical protein
MEAVEQHVDQFHEQRPNRHLPATEAEARTKPHWTYQDEDPGSDSQDHMISCLLADMDKNGHKQVNYDKIKEVTQDLDENPTLFLFFYLFIFSFFFYYS